MSDFIKVIDYAIGHGTGNDFVVIADKTNEITVTPALAREICNRETGIGADGVLIASLPSQSQQASGVDLIMDYLNADGSLAEMCGNGIRVLIAYAKELGWLTDFMAEPITPWVVQTPSGPISVSQIGDGLYLVDMGHAVIGPIVEVTANEMSLLGAGVHVPNPHAVVFVSKLDLFTSMTQAPTISPPEAFSAGTNVEFVERLSDTQARMIIYERGSGLTQSCGTGACAVAAVMATGWGQQGLTVGEPFAGQPVAAGTYQIGVPGGTLSVIVDEGLGVKLIGPAVITGHGQFDSDWWGTHS